MTALAKGKVESGVKYVRRNFLCGLRGRQPGNLADLNAELRRWVAEVANRRMHGTTHERVPVRWDEDRLAMQPVIQGRPPYPYMEDEQRKVARDAYVCWRGSRYSVPWLYAGKEVWVRERGGMSRSATAPNGSPYIARRSDGIRWLRCASTMRVFRSAVASRWQDADSYSAERAGGGAPSSGRV